MGVSPFLVPYVYILNYADNTKTVTFTKRNGVLADTAFSIWSKFSATLLYVSLTLLIII